MSSQTEQEQAPKVLAIGFLPPPLGGISVSFKLFCDIAAEDAKVGLEVVNLSAFSRSRSRFLPREALQLLEQIWIGAGKCDVALLYCATPQVATLGLMTLAVCRLRGKRFILRKAAGMDYLALGMLSGRVAGFVVERADLFLAQTRQLAEACLARGVVRTKWLPTSRPLGSLLEDERECRRFVYVGQVRPSKGILELISAAEKLPADAVLDVYGPFFDGLDETLFRPGGRARYKGVLDSGDVVPTLRQYDAFVLPSKATSEGYPGAILEAFSVGLPVIATTVGGIPEIVDERCGILVQPGNEEALVGAMCRLVADRSAYQALCEGARKARERFSSEHWNKWLVQECLQLSRNSETVRHS
jgi:glycosyltransferase involved in cell wall biosynthesis